MSQEEKLKWLQNELRLKLHSMGIKKHIRVCTVVTNEDNVWTTFRDLAASIKLSKPMKDYLSKYITEQCSLTPHPLFVMIFAVFLCFGLLFSFEWMLDSQMYHNKIDQTGTGSLVSPGEYCLIMESKALQFSTR